MTERTASGLAASALRLTSIPGTVKVLPGGGPGMSIDLDGPESLAAEVRWEVRNGILHIEGPEHGGGQGVMMIRTRGPEGLSTSVIRSHGGMVITTGGSISVAGQTVIHTGRGRVIVNGQDVTPAADAGAVALTVRVPAGTPVQVADDGTGQYEIGSTGGHLDARLSGAAELSAGDVRAARIAVRGSGTVTIASVQSALAADVAGSGRVDVRGGSVTSLRASVAGSGDVLFRGTAQDADLSVAGSGDISVDTVTGSLRKSAAGSGRIDVRVQPDRSADDFWS